MTGEPSATRALDRLGLHTLDRLSPRVRPRIDPRALQIGIVHLGIGAFHRAHQAVFTEDAVACAGGDWGICGVTQRSAGVVEQLAPQDGLYSVADRGRDREELRVVGVVRELRWARAELDAVLERMAAPSTAVISLTVTEKGYHRDPASDRLLLDSPDIVADLAGGAPRTVIGQLVAGLERRRRRHGAPVTILCCDNLPENGRVLRALVHEFAARRDDDDGLVSWIGEQVRFPCTMVDRIVPATTDEDLADIAGRLGVRDHGAVVTEPFRQWVIEDDFAAARPAWERAGAILTADVRPYELVKLRMLNGSHSTIAYLAALGDNAFVAEAMDPDGPLRSVAERLMTDDVAPTLAIPDGFDLDVYREELLDRFANPALRHRTLQVAMDGSQKLPQRLLGTVLDRRAAGAEPRYATLGVAAWMRFVSARRSDGGRPLTIEDPLAEAIARRLRDRREPGEVVDALLAMREIFSEQLGGDPVVRELLVEHLEMLERDGAIRTAQRVAVTEGSAGR